jgi:hypothetical protein
VLSPSPLSQSQVEVPTPISAVSTKEAFKGVGFAFSYPMHPMTLSRLVFEPNLKYFPQELGDIVDIDIDNDTNEEDDENEYKSVECKNIKKVFNLYYSKCVFYPIPD